MKFFHIADLHIGRRVNGRSLIEDQEHILKQILALCDGEKPDAMFIAGDIYDRTIPSEEAVSLYDSFLVSLSKRGIPTYIISGNHDSEERVAFGGRLMDLSGIHTAPMYRGKIEPFELDPGDGFGTVKVWPIPFLKPSDVGPKMPDRKIESYEDAMRAVVESLELDPEERNIALAHQFITGASVSGSEDDISVGGLDRIPASVFDPFDYVALGHLHGPQSIEREAVRYAGSPLKYSFNETEQKKSLTVGTLGAKGSLEIREIPLVPLRDMRAVEGSFDEIMKMDGSDDYLMVTLTDINEIINGMPRLRSHFPNVMILRYKNESGGGRTGGEAPDTENRSPAELFAELFEKQNGRAMSDGEREFTAKLIEEIWRCSE